MSTPAPTGRRVPGNDRLIGSTLKGTYEIIERMSQGGMGVIYRAVQHPLERVVVIKTIAPDQTDGEQRFFREARALSLVQHPNVVGLLDFGLAECGLLFMAMEHLEGCTLHECVPPAVGLPSDVAAEIMCQICAGVGAIHHHRLVHRDLKPSNIFLAQMADGGVLVKVLDLGIAKTLGNGGEAPLTQTGMMMGSCGYMAPEQIHGEAETDSRADIYALGAILYSMLAGRPAYRGENTAEILSRQLTRRPDPIDFEQLAKPAAEGYMTVILTAMHPDPGQRYPTARDLLLAVRAVEGDRTVSARLNDRIPWPTRRLPVLPGPAGADAPTPIREAANAASDPRTMPPPVPHEIQTVASPVAASPEADHASAPLSPVFAVSPAPSSGAPGHPPSAPASGAAARPTVDTESPHGQAAFSVFFGVLTSGLLSVLVMVWLRPAPPGDAGRGGGGVDSPEARATPSAPAEESSASLAGPGVTGTEVVFGMTAPFTGPAEQLGRELALGINLGFRQANELGGIHGRAVRLLTKDDRYEPDLALANMNGFVAERSVLGCVGNVGTPTAAKTLPFALEHNLLFFAPFTGAAFLRNDPPDRYVFNFRASYEEETAAMVKHFFAVRKLQPEQIAVFAQQDAFGDAGFRGVVRMFRHAGHDPERILRVGYPRNTVDVAAAAEAILARPELRAVILVATYRPAAAFVRLIRERRPEMILAAVSFVNADALAEELRSVYPAGAPGLIVTQVVPHFESHSTAVRRYRQLMARFAPDERPGFTSLEGYLSANLLIEGLRRAGRGLTSERLVDALESVHDFDAGVGLPVRLNPTDHQASHKVWATALDMDFRLKPFELD